MPKRLDHKIRALILLSTLPCSYTALAQEPIWVINAYRQTGTGSTPEAACRDYASKWHVYFYRLGRSTGWNYVPPRYQCWIYSHPENIPDSIFYQGEIFLSDGACPSAKTFDPILGECISPAGAPRENKICNATQNTSANLAQVLADVDTGNNFQPETDITTSDFSFKRFYNSSTGTWRHGYSSHLKIEDWRITLTEFDGKIINFERDGDSAKNSIELAARLVKQQDSWIYTSANNTKQVFDMLGRLTLQQSPDQTTLHFSYTENSTIIETERAGRFTLKSDANHQPLQLESSGLSIAYEYMDGKLIRVRRSDAPDTPRIYHYEDQRDTNLLTGITDERGIRYATWTYDNHGRAISSEYAGGGNRSSVSFNTDGSTTTTNALGKRTTYRFQTIQGMRRISAIEGEPSANCPNSNSTFTYDDRALMKTRTDNKGNVTTFDYNDRGLEVSRTEAFGTPQARTVTTTWHPTLNLPLTVTEADRITTYTYDNHGRQLTKHVDTQ
ncbi:DUF6531 domain-containing protein [Pseudomonas sp. PDM13]|uniref:DUF6531 domain-containing protein n=1 Tax=Pseudomonas sp. PDM13 TaxID=2769255 RepID=UPI0021DF7A1F|nr:DUF6531 domain-containing protein [Pseudomonas sp. PDM13]MCU9947843.1 DUF6531 domain-containing protein [Pseudomonas sp. PDM13]